MTDLVQSYFIGVSRVGEYNNSDNNNNTKRKRVTDHTKNHFVREHVKDII